MANQPISDDAGPRVDGGAEPDLAIGADEAIVLLDLDHRQATAGGSIQLKAATDLLHNSGVVSAANNGKISYSAGLFSAQGAITMGSGAGRLLGCHGSSTDGGTCWSR